MSLMKRTQSIFTIVLVGLFTLTGVVACGGTESGSRFDDKDSVTTTDSAVDGVGDVAVDTTPGETVPDVQSGDGVPEEVGPTCESFCDDEWGRACYGTGYRVCQDPDDDSCFDWSDVVACSPGTICNGGECVVSCPGQECTVVGAHKCGDDATVLECGDFDGDGCLEWGNPVGCADGLICSGGFCATTCTNGCTVIGANKCEGNDIVTCGDYNSDGCLEWADAKSCGTQICSNGFCQASCANECTINGSRKCEGNGYKTCGDYNTDGCLEWGTVVNCGQSQTCSNGFCLDVCENECTAVGAKKCELDAIVTCNDYNDDGCLEWGTPVNCDAGLICNGGHCETTCTDECTVAKAKKCDEGGNVTICDEHDEDGCLEWGSPLPCGNPYVCSEGNCLLECADECSVINDKKCVTGSTTQFAICDDWNEDGCLEWGTPTECGDTLVCSGGNCAISCQSDCAVANETRCEGNGVETCGDYNDDGCLEWGTPNYCEVWQECQNGSCAQAQPPATVLINEILYDSEGEDTETWVELRGPAGTDMAGFRLVGVDGIDGSDYNPIALSGLIPADGYYLIVHTSATSALNDLGDQFSEDVDFQNGPDSVELRYGSIITDALGYGSFGPEEVFAGEGVAAEDVGANISLGRNVLGTDTDNNSADFTSFNNPTPGAENLKVNQPPNAVLSCPTSGNTGDMLDFDGSQSSDPDGSIETYAFDFGDGATMEGPLTAEQHAYDTPGAYQVTLTVYDDGGLTDVASCDLSIGDTQMPTVQFIKPSAAKQVTQGDTVSVLIDATPAPGRSVTKVELLADGEVYGAADFEAPYEFSYVVPWNQATDTTISLQAKATDSVSSVGFSDTIPLSVMNDMPVPSFTAVVTGTLEVTMDANGSYDTETETEALEVRWDVDADGTWDTEWSTEKVNVHTYPSDGAYTIKVAVRDGAGQIESTTREVILSSLQYVSGEVTTTTWTGTIVITGDVTVPSGNTLTISEGTSVLFAFIDQDENGYGDYGIQINGTLLVEGTELKPVIFTTVGAEKAPKQWDRIKLVGSDHNIQWAIIEYATVGIESQGSGTIEDSVFRFCQQGIKASHSSSQLTVTRSTLTENLEYGFLNDKGVSTLSQMTVTKNGKHGIYDVTGTLNLSNSTVKLNEGTGITYRGAVDGLVTRNLIAFNALEGVRVETNGSSDPSAVINYNNIYGNATVAARVVDAISLYASKSGSSGSAFSEPWSTPNGEGLQWLKASYSENDYNYYNYYMGYVRKDNASGQTLFSSSTAVGAKWYHVNENLVASTIVAQVLSNTSSSSYNGSCSASAVAYELEGAVRELSVLTLSERIDARHNYFGDSVFPNVLDVVTVGDTNSVNVEGFVGVAFDETWSKGKYFGGEELSEDTDWISEVIVTGQIGVPSGVTLTIDEGVNVRFGCVDANENGIGDCDIVVNGGSIDVNGTSGSPVTFTDYDAVKEIDAFLYVRVSSGSSNIAHAVIEYANQGLRLMGGTHVVDHLTARHNRSSGVYIKQASGVTITGPVITDNEGAGIKIEGSSNVSIDKAAGQVATITDNGGDGLYVDYSPTGISAENGITLSNANVTGNGNAGVFMRNSYVDVDHCTISQNTYGLYWAADSQGELSNSNIKYNERDGLVLATDGSSDPTPEIHGNNIFGNSVSERSLYLDPGVSISKSSSSGTATSGGWTSPNDEILMFMRVAYSESDYNYYNYYNGKVTKQNGSSASTVWSASTAVGAKFIDIANQGVSSFTASVTSNTSSSSYNATTSVSGVAYYTDSSAGEETELLAITNGGTVSCTDNYWGLGLANLGDLPDKLTLGRSNAVDYSGQVGTEKSGTGPQ